MPESPESTITINEPVKTLKDALEKVRERKITAGLTPEDAQQQIKNIEKMIANSPTNIREKLTEEIMNSANRPNTEIHHGPITPSNPHGWPTVKTEK